MKKTFLTEQILHVKNRYTQKLVHLCIGLPIYLLAFFSLAWVAAKSVDLPKPIIWKLNNPSLVGTHKPQILGAPAVVRENTQTALSFDGVDDGLIVPVNPVAGWKQFTVEVLFKPDASGPVAPRFVHFQDTVGNRGTIELRLTTDGQWYMDTFLKNGKTNEGLTLIDSTQLHPANKWYWAALVFDGKKMTHYVNAQKELDGDIDFGPMTTGQISLGVRLNQVNWFKGQIREIRFHPTALNCKALQHFK